LKNKQIAYIFTFCIFLISLNLFAQDSQSNVDKDFLDSLPDAVKDDVLDEIKSSNKDNKKLYNNIPTVALEKSQTLRKWERFLQENEQLDNKSEIFGIDFFRNFQSTFSPTNVPNFNDDYVADFGDKFQIQIIGQINVDEEVEVLRDGTIMIPKVGNVSVAGLPLNKVNELVSSEISQKYIGAEVFISLSEVRDIQVSLTGRAFSPGIYTLSGNSNLVHLLNVAGGILDSGSFREIHLKRNGKTYQIVDLYDFFVDGNTQFSNKLRSGDSVVIMPAKSMVRISGGVERPALYELKDGQTLKDLLDYAQGFTNFADTESIVFENVKNKAIVSSKINQMDLPSIQASHGMSLYINEFKLKQVTITGAVENPGTYSIIDEEKLSDIITRAGGYKENAYPIGGMLFNEKAKKMQLENNERIYSSIIKSLVQSLTSIAQRSTGDGAGTAQIVGMLLADIKSHKPDGRIVADFDLENIGQNPLNDTLISHNDRIHIPIITQQVFVFGEVGLPGAVRYGPNKTVKDYLNERGGLTGNSYSEAIIVEPNGRVVQVASSGGIFNKFLTSDYNPMPGTVIYVPNDYSAVNGLPALSVIAPIFASFALTLASLSNLSD
tara:strand:- start:2889 stop:4709 length:1821 start_codon:yes stop_codon:yes gene_type:complete